MVVPEITDFSFHTTFFVALGRIAELTGKAPVRTESDELFRLFALVATQDLLHRGFQVVVTECPEHSRSRQSRAHELPETLTVWLGSRRGERQRAKMLHIERTCIYRLSGQLQRTGGCGTQVATPVSPKSFFFLRTYSRTVDSAIKQAGISAGSDARSFARCAAVCVASSDRSSALRR